MTGFDPWADVLVAEIAGQKIRAPQYGLRGNPVTREEWTAIHDGVRRVINEPGMYMARAGGWP